MFRQFMPLIVFDFVKYKMSKKQIFFLYISHIPPSSLYLPGLGQALPHSSFLLRFHKALG